jgi:7,8-dihydropterin-6-yl-methyl-4-(beta-D-ribofuranosyl)aminobenzene 5'-phosphate synthase
MRKEPLTFTIKVVFDDKCAEEGFLKGFGFAASIYNHITKNNILFDTGGNANTLIHNLKESNLEIATINKIIISHNHSDHSGGLGGIYKINPDINIYVPIECKKSYSNIYNRSEVIGISELLEIEQNIFTSGQIGTSIKEQALFLKTINNKIIIIVGCAHPGLENFILKAKELAPIQAIIGGFHDFKKYSYLKDIDLIGACHCTFDLDTIQKRLPKQFKRICVGTSLRF